MTPSPASSFLYDEGFARNLGWLTREQDKLRRSSVAIAGLGVGGVYLTTLARLGMGSFTLADFDRFALPNFNRQAGAMVSTLHRPKLDVMAQVARDINPQVEIRPFPRGVQREGVDAFLDGADAYLDGLDSFALDIREAVFARCAERAIPATTVAPLGIGAALLNFVPGSMDFESYFGLRGRAEDENALRFLTGLSPVVAAPHGLRWDTYRDRLVRTWRPRGHENPLTRWIARRRLAAMRSS
jgi:molybdopterin/thiamine biosynthesis adenylyltransferase